MNTLLLMGLAVIIILLFIILITVVSSRRETKQDVQNSIKNLSEMTMTQLENVRQTMELRLQILQEDNNRQLDRMRNTVDEKLQQTLESRITQSFALVNQQLAQVSRGFGEMQTLAGSVGDIKKVLANVKTRGVLGEVQLWAILNQILAPDQFRENVKTKSSGTGFVEFAVILPGDDAGNVYLPIDSKFPGDVYNHLLDAQESGKREEIKAAEKALVDAIKKSAKDIRDKYIDPPHTTEFGILFLPFEGLYAEVARLGMVEELQNQYKINITGPSTMAAFLNSLQMGFKTLAIQKRSGEVWRTLEAVKTEFAQFESVLGRMKLKLNQTHTELDKLLGPRTNQINRKLRGVSEMDGKESSTLLGMDQFPVGDHTEEEI